ncbi:MAG: aminotransferase class I/II-fold pyridoxal phosphate-dependent enzyme [Gammaproteobacteria bacterium]|nr:aminotransferase class I/II-fold pyridoxal phosphate-dependent enzyme [Gammaproteobacteria bacterium]
MARQAQRLQHISPFRVVELLERAKALEAAGHRVVHLEVGEPDFPTAAPIVAAAHRALEAGATGYTQALGIPELRERIARFYRETAGVEVAPERVVVTAGASGGLLLLSALLLGPEDELLLTDPGYPCNQVFARLVNAVPAAVRCRPEDGFRIDPQAVAAAWTAATRGVLVASPANPTGAVLDTDTLRALSRVVRERDGCLILDEIYQGLTYDRQAEPGAGCATGLAVDDGAYVLNSFSKFFGMTGWRLGWMVVPAEDVPSVARLAQNLFISPNSIAQHAAMAAFDSEAMAIHESRRQTFARRLEQLCDGLEGLGFAIPVRPGGAFYVYADVSHTGLDALDFCWRLLEEHHVAATPGIDFGRYQCERFVRFAFTTGEAEIALGLERMATALESWGAA